MRSLLNVFILQQYSEDLNRRIQVQHIGTSPALESGDPDAWLRDVSLYSANNIPSGSQIQVQDLPRTDWKDQSGAGSSLPDQDHSDGLQYQSLAIDPDRLSSVRLTPRSLPTLLLLLPIPLDILLAELQSPLILG